MTQVIPPASLYSIHPFEQYSAEQNNLWKQLFLILDQIYLRTGGTTDDTDDLANQIAANENQIAFLLALLQDARDKIDNLTALDHPYQVPIVIGMDEANVSSAYTAVDNQEINCTQGPIITMPTSGRVKVNNIDGATVTVNLSGSQTIFGESSVLIQSKGSVVFKYLPESDRWVFE